MPVLGFERPSRVRWELITRFEVLKKGEYSRAVKSYTGAEDFFREHFPGRPLVPQAFFIEMVAQAGGVLFGLGIDFQKEVILAKVEDASFWLDVAPPCELVVEARMEDESEDGAWVRGSVSHAGKKVMEVKILLAAVESVVEGRTNIVFNEHFMKSYDIRGIAERSRALGSTAS